MPLGKKVGNSSKTGGAASIYTTADQKKFRKYANKTVGSVTEAVDVPEATKEVVTNQVWSHKTLGNIRYK